MLGLVLLAMIGAEIGMNAWYWVVYGIYAFVTILKLFFEE